MVPTSAPRRPGRAPMIALVMVLGVCAPGMARPGGRADAPDRASSRARGPATRASTPKKNRPRPELTPVYAEIVVDANTGAVLCADRAEERRHPASLTKIMTLYLLFERLEAGQIRLDTEFPVSEYASEQEPTKLDLEVGETLSVRDAILGLVTRSANDAAVVVAEALGGDEETFAAAMTARARSLGMKDTVYRNASGLPDPEQITTARDQALLGLAIQRRFPAYYHYFSTRSFTRDGTTFRNHNHLLSRVEGMDGIKTGYIRSSKFNLVASVRRDDRHLVAVVMGGSSARTRDARMRDLIEQNIPGAEPHRPTTIATLAVRPSVQARSTRAND